MARTRSSRPRSRTPDGRPKRASKSKAKDSSSRDYGEISGEDLEERPEELYLDADEEQELLESSDSGDEGNGVAREKPTGRSLEAPTPGNIQEEGFIDAFYQPRSFSGLVVLFFFVVYGSIWNEDAMKGGDEKVKRIRSGLLLAGSSFLLYCMMQLRDGHLLRPHPALWRIVHGTGLIYLLLLAYLLCQDWNGVVDFLKLFDAKVGEDEAEKDYAKDCRVWVEGETGGFINVMDQVYDVFMVAHFLGWTLKALILRDWGLMWVASVLFEVLETSFGHLYPNFNECWWDHLVLDIFGCNFIGMCLGMYLVERITTHQFNWTGRPSTSFGKMKRVALQFTPYSFETYRWHVFESWRRFAIGVSVLIILLLGEMNAFFIKSTFKIPIKSDLNYYRLSFWVLMTYMAVFEFNWYAQGKSRRVGVNSWLAGSLVTLETTLVVKHSNFPPDKLWPAHYIMTGWQATFLLAALLGLVKAARKLVMWYAGAQEVFEPGKKKSAKKGSFKALEKAVPGSTRFVQLTHALDSAFQALTFAIPMPLIIVLIMDCYRTYSYPPPKPGENGW